MSQELFYTSAPKGLLPGSRGFCTVATTRGMSPALVEKLESLSGYRHLFPPLDPKAAQNPIAFSHVRIQAMGKVYSVLSRVCAAGLDYSERTNKFAHHVVLENAELPPGGPAWLLQQPGFMEQAWDGEIKVLPSGRNVPSGDSVAAISQAWQDLTGDAGWAGVLAESVSTGMDRAVYLIFEPGMEVLPLLAEALALLPSERRWEITFNSYFTGLSQGLSCVWRCVPNGSAEAKNARRLPNAFILNLSVPLGTAQGGTLVEYARSGQRTTTVGVRETERIPSALVGVRSPSRSLGAERIIRTPAFGEAFPAFDDESSAAKTGPYPLASSSDAPEPLVSPPPLPPTKKLRGDLRRTTARAWAFGLALGTAFGVLLTLTVLTAFWYLGGFALVKQESKAELNPFATNTAPDKSSDDAKKVELDVKSVVNVGPKQAAGDKGKSSTSPAAGNEKKESLPKPSRQVPPKVANTQKDQTINMIDKQSTGKLAELKVQTYVPLPPWAPTHTEPKELSAEIKFDPDKSLVLDLRGDKTFSYPGGLQAKLIAEWGKNNKLIVRYKAEAPITRAPVEEDVAEFELRNKSVLFQWKQNAKQPAQAARERIRNSILEIKGPGQQREYWSFWKRPAPQEVVVSFPDSEQRRALIFDKPPAFERQITLDWKNPLPESLDRVFFEEPGLEHDGEPLILQFTPRDKDCWAGLQSEPKNLEIDKRFTGTKSVTCLIRVLIVEIPKDKRSVAIKLEILKLVIDSRQDNSKKVAPNPTRSGPPEDCDHQVVLRSLKIFTRIDGIRVDLFEFKGKTGQQKPRPSNGPQPKAGSV